jgi:tetratricopeptide (TPR) repeat protein
LAFAVGLLIGTTNGCIAKAPTDQNDLTRMATELFEKNEKQQAIDLERKAVKHHKRNGMSHAFLSYFLFENGKYPEALREGKMAARLMPRSVVNLGMMQQELGCHKAAVESFAKARAVNPSDWKAWIGQAKSLMLLERPDESILILQEMLSRKSADFDGQYQLAQELLYFDKPALATIAANQALKLANTPEQKSAALSRLFLSYIRDNDTKHADALMYQLFAENKPTDGEVYVAAASMLNVLKPEAADEILNAAILNLNKFNDPGALYQLFTIFDYKASLVKYDRTKYGAWLKDAELAYRRASELNRIPPGRINLGLAYLLAEQRKTEELIHELSKADTADMQNQILGYLLSKLQPVASTNDNLSANAIPQPGNLVLTKAQVAVNGLTCACKRSLIIDSFKQIRGLVLTTISYQYPYVATILVDESMIPLSDVMVQIDHRPLPEFTYKLISASPVRGADEILAIDLAGRNILTPPPPEVWPKLHPSLPQDSFASHNSSR